MTTFSNYALRLPASLMGDLRGAADADGVSMNSFIVQAVAEKVASLRARGTLGPLSEAEQAAFLDARAARAKVDGMRAILGKAGVNAADLPEDKIPDGWLETAATAG